MIIRIKEKNAVPVLKQIRELPEKVLQAAAKGLAAGLLHVAGVSQNQFLAGPRPSRLGEVTGRLRRSIATRVITVPGRGVVGQIGTNVPYGAFHEFGFSGDMPVSAHTRILRHVSRANSGTAPAGSAPGPRTVNVRAHVRTIKYAGRPFIGPALEQSHQLIAERIRSELAKV